MCDLNAYYKDYDEGGRFVRDNAHRIEFITSKLYLDRYLAPRSTILDACAGTGQYAFYLAGLGHRVTAADIVGSNVEKIKLIQHDNPTLNSIFEGDTRELPQFKDGSFDAVLCMGALYHIFEAQERKKAILECLRVLKPGGIIAVSYINRFARFFLSLCSENSLSPAFLDDAKGTFETGVDGCFYISTPDEMEALFIECGIEKICNIGADGVGYAAVDKINALDSTAFSKWLNYHLKTCEEPSILGYSLHCLYIGRKNSAQICTQIL